MDEDKEVSCSQNTLFRAICLLLAIVFGYAEVAEGDQHPASGVKPVTDLFSRIIEDTRNLRYPQNNPYREPIQDRIPLWIPHPCEVDPEGAGWRSESRPTTVHKLRPGDIDVIAAIGDSLSVGISAREIHPFGVLIQDRGVSMTGGGVGTWREITTLPNLIKIFNPNVTGFATGRGDFLSYNAQLNVAITGEIDDDLHNQVLILMKKMKRNKKIDFNNDWKLLSILIGHNDLCAYYCFDREKHSSRQHFLHLQKVLDYLYKNVPKMYVNLLSILDPTIAIQQRISNSLTCEVIRRVLCACLYVSPNIEETKVDISSQVREYQAVEEELYLPCSTSWISAVKFGRTTAS